VPNSFPDDVGSNFVLRNDICTESLVCSYYLEDARSSLHLWMGSVFFESGSTYTGVKTAREAYFMGYRRNFPDGLQRVEGVAKYTTFRHYSIV
jgi:hypothetical protein